MTGSPKSVLSPQVLSFLTAGTRTGKLGWVAADGRPLVAPVWFVVEDDHLLFNTGAGTAKGRALARDPRVVLTVDVEQPPYAFVQVQGIAEVIEDLGEVRRIATLAAARYMGPERAEEFGARNGVPGELGVRLRPTKVVADFDVSS
jgi:PPOX class probable F420-dependent enzyme